MEILKDISLRPYNTFGVDAKARYFAEYNSETELKELLQSDTVKQNRILHIGGGSNLLFLNDFDGIILHSGIRTIELFEENPESVLLRVGSGVIWDDFVEYCVQKNYYGVENLSLIPGEVGASAVQNIGAYGMEAGDTIEKVKLIEIETLRTRILSNKACKYSYRNSIFKEELKGKAIITHVFFRLKKQAVFVLDYANLKESVRQKGEITLRTIRNTVIEIRASKLPNPSVLGNAGSFFMNPVIPKAQFDELLITHPAMPHYTVSDTEVKIPAGWLIEQCNLKGKQFESAGIYHKQALVIVNLGNATGRDIASVALLVQKTVKNQFGIDLIPEVNYIA